jgi:hypothetical protein
MGLFDVVSRSSSRLGCCIRSSRLVLAIHFLFASQAGAQDCQFFLLPRYEGPAVNLQIGQSQEGGAGNSGDPCISFRVLSLDAAIRIDVLDRVEGETGDYPHVFLYSAESNAHSFGTDQYCGRNVRVTCLRRTARFGLPPI